LDRSENGETRRSRTRRRRRGVGVGEELPLWSESAQTELVPFRQHYVSKEGWIEEGKGRRAHSDEGIESLLEERNLC